MHKSRKNKTLNEPTKEKLQEDIVDNYFSFFEYKWNGVFKKNKMEGDQINNAPKIIKYSRWKFAGIGMPCIRQTK